MAFINLY